VAEHLESPEALKSVQATGALKVRPIACSDVVIALVDQRRHIQNFCCLVGPLREQARSHRGMHFNCGSEPAREGGLKSNINY
jgi:hypothetical protein